MRAGNERGLVEKKERSLTAESLEQATINGTMYFRF